MCCVCSVEDNCDIIEVIEVIEDNCHIEDGSLCK